MKNLVTLLGLSLAVGSQAQPSARPNVLFILADDLGWNDLGCMGSTFYETPNLDKLASQGMLFTDAYAACQVSSPSRASLMTGKYTTHHGVTNWIGEKSGVDWRSMKRNNKLLPAPYQWELGPDEVTLAEAFQAQGYRTFIAGKWHLGEEGSWPEDHGFDVNVGGWSSGGPRGGYFGPYINPKLQSRYDGESLTLRLAQETAAFIKGQKERQEPFFAYLSFYAVHGPIQTTHERCRYFQQKAAQQGIAPQGFEVDRTLPVRQVQDNPIYAGLLQQMDEAIGLVLDSLDALGLADETLVVFTSDNGGVTSGDSFSTSLLPLRGGKGRQWEGGIRVPLLMRVPGIKPQQTCSTPVSGIDFYDTLLDFAQLKSSRRHHTDGVSLMPLFYGGELKPRSLFWHYPHYGNQGGEPSSIIRQGDWKLIYYHEDQRCELYNLALDLTESQTLNHLYPKQVATLSTDLKRWLKQTHALMPVADEHYQPLKETQVKQQWATKTLKQQEQIRLHQLSSSFKQDESKF